MYGETCHVGRTSTDGGLGAATIDVSMDDGTRDGAADGDIDISCHQGAVTATIDVARDISVGLKDFDRGAAIDRRFLATTIDVTANDSLIGIGVAADGHDGVGRHRGTGTLTTAEDIAAGEVALLGNGAAEESDFGSAEVVGGHNVHLTEGVVLSALRGCVGSLVTTTIDIMYNQFTIVIGVGVDNDGDLALDRTVEVAATEDILDGASMKNNSHIATIASGVGNTVACGTLLTGETFDVSRNTRHTLATTKHIADGATINNKCDIPIEVGRFTCSVNIAVYSIVTIYNNRLTTNMFCRCSTASVLINGCRAFPGRSIVWISI